MFVCCECCVLSGSGLCDGLITRPEDSYRLWRVVLCDQETSYARRLQPARGLQNTNPQWVVAAVEKKISDPVNNSNFAMLKCPIHSRFRQEYEDTGSR
jgi:hypothetical protein